DEVVVTPEGDVIISGGAKAGSSSNDVFTIKYDGDTGSTIWQNQYGTSANESVRDLILAEDGDAVVLISGPFGVDRQWVVLRVDGTTGDQRWVTLVDPGFDESFGSITEGPAGTIFATGATDPDGDDSNTNENVITIAYEADTGAVRWLSEFGDAGFGDAEYGASLQVGADGLLRVLGSTIADALTGEMFDRDALMLTYDPADGALLGVSLYEFSDPGSEDGDRFYTSGLDAMGRVYAFGVANSGDLLATRFSFPSACSPDLDGDGKLDFFDVSAFLNAYNAMDPVADFNGDGKFSFFDVSSFLNQFNAGCP
ncbi:MAG: GC-type dockerin domain-anchored protein, partial [Phycisphaerales bacterium]